MVLPFKVNANGIEYYVKEQSFPIHIVIENCIVSAIVLYVALDNTFSLH